MKTTSDLRSIMRQKVNQLMTTDPVPDISRLCEFIDLILDDINELLDEKRKLEMDIWRGDHHG